MKILVQLGLLFSICLISNLISAHLPFTFPGSVMAMVIMLILLFTGILKMRHIETVSDFLTRNMAILFIPVTVGIHSCYDLVKHKLGALIFICCITTVITFGVAGLVAAGVASLQKRLTGERNAE